MLMMRTHTRKKMVFRRCKWGRYQIAHNSYAPDFGARPLKRAIQRELQDPLALKILSGDLAEGALIKVDAGKDGLTFSA